MTFVVPLLQEKKYTNISRILLSENLFFATERNLDVNQDLTFT